MKHITRRRVLIGGSLSTAALSMPCGIRSLFRASIARAEGETPLRLVQMHKPNGTIPDQWLSATGVPGPILSPFAPYSSNMLVMRNLNLIDQPPAGVGQGHETLMLAWSTGGGVGSPYSPGGDDWRSTAASLDQRFAKESPFLGKKATLQVAANKSQNETPNVTLSYRGAGDPIFPELSPSTTYNRLFSTLMSSAPTAAQVALTRARARRASVLDFAKSDLAQLRTMIPTSGRETLDAQEASIRELEKLLDAGSGTPTTASASCAAAQYMPPTVSVANDRASIERVGKEYISVVKAVLTCDLARMVTFMWSPAAADVHHPNTSDSHHNISHKAHFSGSDATSRNQMVEIDTWYAQQAAKFLAMLQSSTDPFGGMLFDRTLMLYFSEISISHTGQDLPLVLFAGNQIGLKKGPVFDAQEKTAQDMWVTIANRFQVPITRLGNDRQFTGPISGLFV